MTRVGRNQPCPCGSGRKFKHCQGRKAPSGTSTDDRTWQRLRRVLDGFPTMLLRFVRNVYGSSAVHEAWEEFHLWDD